MSTAPKKDRAAQLLRSNNMSVTDSRRLILQLFINHKGGALRHSDIEKSLSELDRVTIYRTLQAFTERGVIHSIPGSDGAAKYALCHDTCGEGHHHDNHVHFHCSICGITQCIDEVTIPAIALPNGFVPERTEMVVTGKCLQCGKKVADQVRVKSVAG